MPPLRTSQAPQFKNLLFGVYHTTAKALHRPFCSGFPWSSKIIENSGIISFPEKSWKIDKNLKVMENLKNFSKV